MKATHILSGILLGAAMLCLPSCLGDDDEDNSQKDLTESQRKMYLTAIDGNYKGKAYFINNENKLDSIDMAWSVNGHDSTAVVYEFPVELLAEYLHEGISARDWLLAGKKRDVHFSIHPAFTSTEDIANKEYAYYFIPDNFVLKYKEGNIEYTLGFGNYLKIDNIVYSPVCAYSENKQRFSGNIIVNSISSGVMPYGLDAIFWLSGKKQ